MKNITLKEDFDAEVGIFFNFLNSKEYPQHRNIIFSCFPELKEKIKANVTDEKSVVTAFIQEKRTHNKQAIQQSVAFVKHELEQKGEKTLEILARLMDYVWKSQEDPYFLVPTIFPLSPFNKDTFFFSIYPSLQGKTEYPRVLAVSAHEISHMILLDILKERNIQMGQELVYFVKELIAPVLVYQDDFDGMFKKQIVGNYNVLEVYFEEGGKSVTAFDYFLAMFANNRAEGKKFNAFLDDMISVCRKIEQEIQDKRAFDDEYGTRILKEPELLEKFREPIVLM